MSKLRKSAPLRASNALLKAASPAGMRANVIDRLTRLEQFDRTMGANIFGLISHYFVYRNPAARPMRLRATGRTVVRTR